METCVKKDCPFIPFCKDYKLAEDKGERCKTQMQILERAKGLLHGHDVKREAPSDKLLAMIHGDCRYCAHNGSRLDGPCKGCVHFAAKEFIEGDYWECKEVGG